MSVFMKMIDDIAPVWRQVDRCIRENGLIDDDFVTNLITEQLFSQKSLSSLQDDLADENQRKTNLLASQMEVLKLFEIDYQELKSLFDEQDSNNIKYNSETTLVGIQFSQNQVKIQNLLDKHAIQYQFCYSAYSSLSFIILRSLFILKEVMKLFNCQIYFEKGSSTFSDSLLTEINKYEHSLKKRYGDATKKLKSFVRAANQK